MKNFFYAIKVFCVFIFAFLAISGCAGIQMANVKPGPNPIYSYKFDYTPKAEKSLKEPLTVLLISPTYQATFPSQYGIMQGGVINPSQIYVSPYGGTFSGASPELIRDVNKIIDDYSRTMGEDLKEMMAKRNFRLIETVKEKETATFSQRDQSNFGLDIKVTVELNDEILESHDPEKNIITNQYSVGSRKGRIGLKSRITFEVKEPISWQLLLVKSIETDQMIQDYQYKWNYQDNLSGVIVGEDERAKVIASLLEKSYSDTMDKLYTYLDPDEFAILSKQAQEIKKNATGIVR